MIIGLMGEMGSGKDEAFVQLKKLNVDVVRYAFGDEIKKVVQKAWNIPRTDMVRKPSHVRELLQIVGTNLVRDQIDEYQWIRKTNESIIRNDDAHRTGTRTCKHIIITDVRFLNEVKWIQDDLGIIIRINRKDNKISSSTSKKHTSHRSENEWKTAKNVKFINNDGTRKELGLKLKQILEEEN